MPATHRAALEQVRALDRESFDGLLGALTDTTSYAPLRDLGEEIATATPLTQDQAHSVVLALVSLYAQVKFHNFTIRDLADGTSTSPDLTAYDDRPASEFADRLEAMLNTKVITTTGRALDLLAEHEHRFHSARLLTDIRPVFGDDPKEQPSGAVITETLKLDFFDQSGSRSLFIALDQEDLKQLQDTVNRAVDKIESLRGFLHDANLAHFEVSSEDNA